jgi:acyl-CoA reductase-like NAD-dependent aldehyde dehydrogenase
MIVPRARMAEVSEIARAAVERLTLGHPLEAGTRLGPLASAGQQHRVREYIGLGMAEAPLVVGGPKQPVGLDRGFYVLPTVFADVENSSRIAQEEIFGPVLAIIAHDGDDDAVRLANDSPYGLSGVVWSVDEERAMGIARRMRTGQVDINRAQFNPAAPFGGYKKSGVGREFGVFGIEDFTEVKAVQR